MILVVIVAWGAWAVTGKLALRTMDPWTVQLCTAYVYSAVAPIAYVGMKWRGMPIEWTRSGTAWSVLSALLTTVAGYAFLLAVDRRPVNEVLRFTQLYPALGFLLCWLVLGESFTVMKVLGAALMIAGSVAMGW